MILSLDNIYEICKFLSSDDLFNLSLTDREIATISTNYLKKYPSVLKRYDFLFKNFIKLQKSTTDESIRNMITLLLNIPQGKFIDTYSHLVLINISSPIKVKTLTTSVECSIHQRKDTIVYSDKINKLIHIFDFTTPNEPKIIIKQNVNFYDIIKNDTRALVYRSGNHLKGYHIHNEYDSICLVKWKNDQPVLSKSITHPRNIITVFQTSIECIETFDNKHILMYEYLNVDNNLEAFGYAYILDVKRLKIYYFNFLPVLMEMRYCQQVWNDSPFWLKFQRSLRVDKKFFIVNPQKIFELQLVDVNEEWGEVILTGSKNWFPSENSLYEFCPHHEEVVCLDKLFNMYKDNIQ